jgi:hypothetical protein
MKVWSRLCCRLECCDCIQSSRPRAIPRKDLSFSAVQCRHDGCNTLLLKLTDTKLITYATCERHPSIGARVQIPCSSATTNATAASIASWLPRYLNRRAGHYPKRGNFCGSPHNIDIIWTPALCRRALRTLCFCPFDSGLLSSGCC